MNKDVRISELFDSVPPILKKLFDSHEYPWEILDGIAEAIADIAKGGGFHEISCGIFVGEDVKISKSATLIPPLLICDKTEIRPSAYLRGNVIVGKGCVIGNSSEIKNSVLLDGVQVPHYNYVGDSVLGNRAHMGAGSICSNLKSDGRAVVIHGDVDYETGLRKIGGILADGADVGCGCVLNPGTVIGKNTSVYPLTALRGVFPEESIVKTVDNVVKRR